MTRLSPLALALVACLAAPSTARAGSILFTGSGAGSGGVTLNASALFEITGSTLKITLSNLGDTSGWASGSDVAGNTLTGVFFDLPSGVTLSPTAATIAPGDLLQKNKCDIGPCTSSTTNVGGEFVYKTGSWSGHTGADRGISSSGYISASSGNFHGSNLDGPGSPDGINFGIVAPVTGSNPLKPNGGLSKDPLIEGQVVFTMAIAGGPLLETQISNVSFQYGTGLDEAGFAGHGGGTPPSSVPEPAMLLLMVPGLAEVARRRLWRKVGR